MNDLAVLRCRAATLAYGLGCALYLHPDGRIRIVAPEGEDPTAWERIEAPPGAKPTEYGHTLYAQAQT